MKPDDTLDRDWRIDMNKNKFRAYMVRNNDTHVTLAPKLGIGISTLSERLNSKQRPFTLPEIEAFVKLYGLTGDEMYDVFIGD